jgi:hypothetical protein
MSNPKKTRNPQNARQNVSTNPDMEQRRKLAEDLDAQGIYPPAWTTATRAPWSRQAVYRQTGFHDSAKHFIANGELYERANNPVLNPSPEQAAESLKAYLGQAAKPIHEIVPAEQVPLTHPVGRPIAPQSPEQAASMAKLLAEQNVNHETWHQGDPVPPAMQKWIIANGYKTSDIYQGPDGWHYQRNERTLESPEVTRLRLAEAARQTPQNAANVITGTNPDPANAKVAEKILAHWNADTEAPANPEPKSPQPPSVPLSPANDNSKAKDDEKLKAGTSPNSSHQASPLSPQGEAILAGMETAMPPSLENDIRLAQADSGPKSAQKTSIPTAPSADQSVNPSNSGSVSSEGKMMPSEVSSASDGKAPDAVPAQYLNEKAAGHEPWPSIPDDWMTTDQTGKPILTSEASKKLDDYRVYMNGFVGQLKTHPEFHAGIGIDDPSLTVSLLRRYLNPPANPQDRDKSAVIPATDALRQQATVKSAIEGLHNHISNWLTNPSFTSRNSEQIVSKILHLKDGQAIEAPASWSGQTSKFDDAAAGIGALISGDSKNLDSLAALNAVTVDGKALAKVSRTGDRYFVTVDLNNKLHDIYDFGSSGQYVTDKMTHSMRLPDVDLGMLALLAETGRAKPFPVEAHWNSRLTAEIVRVPQAGRIRSPSTFALKNAQWTAE